MKILNFKWVLVLLLGVTFFSCSDDDDDNILNDKYFTVKDGTFKSGNIPSGEESFISDMEVNENVINGGVSIVTFTSSQELSEAYVGVKGIDGYYVSPVKSPKTTYAEEGRYEYEMILLLNQNLSEEKFEISLSAKTSDGKINKVLNSDEIGVIIVGTGKLQISLSWDQLDDVDLYLFEPNKDFPVFYANRFSTEDESELLNFNFYCSLIEKYTNHSTEGFDIESESDWDKVYDYMDDIPATIDLKNEVEKYAESKKDKIKGFLDLDSNAGCNIDGVNNENITFSEVKDGEYIVAVDLYAKCSVSKPGARYALSINYDGKPVTLSGSQNGKFTDSNQGNEGDFDGLIIIGKFKISGGKFAAVTTYSSVELPAFAKNAIGEDARKIAKRFK